ncbi:UNVERIFIED_CONTAM: hypothetical protein Sradi_0754000 [Sesamum radiatum]|uniref:Zinc knuckle CX2CX4HX4C domain-containing protein n=1 Tax=Sesamum radiatum TaxID=300843 RepID=A0AAW2VT62_SESRA
MRFYSKYDLTGTGDGIQATPGGTYSHAISHVIDRKRVVEGCPWSFDKNILILNEVGATENPMQVDLNWCEFYVHIHDLPLSKMNLEIATHVGIKIGRFIGMEDDEAGRAWGASLRIRVALNVNNLLRRALKLRTTGGDEQVVHFTYERLPNFCYLCGRMGHIAKLSAARKQFQQTREKKGLEPPWTVCTLVEQVKFHRPILVFLSETKCKARRVDRLKEKLNYNGIGVDSHGKGGGLMLLWRKDIDVWLQSYSEHHIDTIVSSEEGKGPWRFSGFYGHPEVSKRRTLGIYCIGLAINLLELGFV